MSPKKKTNGSRRTVSYRLKTSTVELLNDLSQATGLSMTEVIERSVDANSRDLVKEVQKLRSEAQARLSDRL